MTYSFAAWPLDVTLGSRKVPIRLWCDYSERQLAGSRQPARSMAFGVVLCAQGKCRFGKKVHMVRLHDGDGNLRMNDPAPPSLPVLRGDEITIDPRLAEGKVTCAAYGYYGHPIVVDGRLWNLTVSDDSTKVAAAPYDGPTGSIRIDQEGNIAEAQLESGEPMTLAMRGHTYELRQGRPVRAPLGSGPSV